MSIITQETQLYMDTDSVYFSAYPMVKQDVEAGHVPWTKDSVISLYDQIGDEVNNRFQILWVMLLMFQ